MLAIPKIRKIVLRNEHVRMMLEEVHRVYPQEACGVILGQFEPDIARAQEVVFTRNAADSSVRFVVDAEELYRILVRAEDEGKDIDRKSVV